MALLTASAATDKTQMRITIDAEIAMQINAYCTMLESKRLTSLLKKRQSLL